MVIIIREWIYFLRVVVPGCDDMYKETIQKTFILAIFGREVLQREYKVLELPARLGGMAFKRPSQISCS